MSLTIAVADAVVTELATGTFSLPIDPVRRVLPDYELADLKELRVTVVPGSVEIEGASRALSQHDLLIDIGIQKKLGTDIDTEVAELCGLVEEIGDYLKRRSLQSVPDAVWVKSMNDPIYASDHLAEQRTFTSVLSVTYRVLK